MPCEFSDCGIIPYSLYVLVMESELSNPFMLFIVEKRPIACLLSNLQIDGVGVQLIIIFANVFVIIVSHN